MVESLRNNLVQACDNEKITLHCPRNTHIMLENVFYGRLVPSNELCPVGGISGASIADEDTSCDVSEARMVSLPHAVGVSLRDPATCCNRIRAEPAQRVPRYPILSHDRRVMSVCVSRECSGNGPDEIGHKNDGGAGRRSVVDSRCVWGTFTRDGASDG